MLDFQPLGFQQCILNTIYGDMVYSRNDLHFRETLPPKSPLIFLHSLGVGSSSYEWSKVYPAFATRYWVIAPDILGWGDSAHPKRDYYPQDYLNLIRTLLMKVAVKPAWVIASSLTAGLTIRLAIQEPHLFKGLFLISPSGYRDFSNSYGKDLISLFFSITGFDRIIYELGIVNKLAVRTFLKQFLFAKSSCLSDEIVDAYLASAAKINSEYSALSSLKGNLYFDLAQYIPDLKVPTIFVWGEQSCFNSPHHGQKLALLNSQWIKSFHMISGAGLLPHLEVPAIIIGLLDKYLG
ncbi:Possible alpha/beta hydrolase superfamily,sll0553 homolog [Richelia intracellularis HM01]|uniref:alpha/beta fold hydrolase n=1 Tax=Richelia intracellularis TaxID=1164990 RepID=UPI0002B50B37|nr:alpha/beta hydrolase [Richelia intracellularis]CCH65392.1 Possible alpha/beta hydrolase superfamily,sll0553 homolog [Richelia intracellularis HM01]